MNNWIPKNRVVRFAIVTTVFSVLLYFAGLLIVLNEIKKIEDFYANTESEVSKEEKFLAIKSIAEINKEPIQTLRDFFVQKGDEVKFIEQVEEAARASSLKFETTSIDVKTDSQNSFEENIDIKMKMEGSWANTMNFMNKLERLPFGVSIENINLDANVSGKWSGSIELIIFREK